MRFSEKTAVDALGNNAGDAAPNPGDGGGLHDIALDGVLRREDGGYVGWGYAFGTLEEAEA